MSRFCAEAAGIAFERLEQRSLFAGGALDVTIGTGTAQSVRFADADGTAVTVSMSAGTATVHLAGDALAQTPAGRDIVVSGTGIALSGVTATGTSRRSSLTVSASGGDGRVTIGGITADGALKQLAAPGAVVTGTVSTGGPVSHFQLLGCENATITLGAGGGTSSVEVTGSAIDTTLTSAAPLRRLTFGVWGGAGGPGGAITAPSITKAVGSVFGGTLSLSGAGVLQFDRVENATINAMGSVKRLSAMSVSASVVDVSGDIGDASFGTLLDTRVYAGVRPLAPDSPIPSSVADFATPSTIRSLFIGSGDLSVDVVVAARFIRQVFLGRVFYTGPIVRHVVADRVTNLRGTIFNNENLRPFHYRRLENEYRLVGNTDIQAL